MTAALLAGCLVAAAAPTRGPVLTLGPVRGGGDPGPESVDLSADGRTATITGRDDKVRTIDPATKKDVPVPAAAPGPDLVERSPGLFDLTDRAGKKVATLFDPDFTLKPEPGSSRDAAEWSLAADGRHLLLSDKKRLSVWRVADGKRVLALALGGFVERWDVRGDDLFRFETVDLSTGRGPSRPVGVMFHWDLKTGRELPRMVLPGLVHHWTPTPDGRVALLPCEVGVVRVDLDTKAVLPTVPVPDADGADVALSPDGGTILVGRRLSEKEVILADYPTGRVRWRAALGVSGYGFVRDLVFAPDGKRVFVSTSSPPALITIDRATGKVLDRELFVPPPKPAAVPVVLAGFAGDGRLVSVAGSGRVERRDVATGTVTDTTIPNGAWVAGQLLPDGKLLAVLVRTPAAESSRRLHFLDLSGPGFRWVSTPEFSSDADKFTVTPDGRFLFIAQTGLRDASLTAVYDLTTGERRHLVPDPPKDHHIDPETGKHRKDDDCRTRGVVTPDGRYELEFGSEGFYVVDRLSTDFAVSVRARDQGNVVLRPGPHLAAACVDLDKTVVYDTRTWGVVRVVPDGGHVDLSPDGRLLSVHYAGLGQVTVWDLAGAPRPKPPPTFPAARRRAAWKTLGERYNAAAKLGAALWFLQHDPQTVPTLARTLRPVSHTPPERVAKWVADLGAADATARADAYSRLLKLGSAARARLEPLAKDDDSATEQARLAASLLRATEKPSDAEWDGVRAVELLERVATPAARALLAEYAAGDPAARLTVEAEAALGRLK